MGSPDDFKDDDSVDVTGLSKVAARARQIKESTPARQLPQIISELKKYLKLKQLNELAYRNLPDDLREEIGTREPQDVFIESLEDETTFDLWDSINVYYGENWTLAEIHDLIAELEK